MDIREYIESGTIEAYVLGLATVEEAAELEQLRKQYPEVNAAILSFEETLERTAMAEAVAPPASVKQKLFAAIAATEQSNGNGKVVTMDKQRSISVWKMIAAASVILLVVSSGLNFYFYDRYKSTNNDYQALLIQQNTLQANNQLMNTKLNDMNESMKIMTDPAVLAVSMPAAKPGSDYRATVYWDTKTKDVYLLSNNLPQPVKGKQYQLWALVDGKPVDAGMMDVCTGVCKMKNIPKAQAFAITLEELGGSPTPHLEQLYVIGNVGS